MAKICSCILMSALLERLGAKRAAAMHKDLEKGWTAEEWLVHFEEEEEFVLPHLPPAIAERIAREHVRMRNQIARYGQITDQKFLDEHAHYEDEVVLKYLGFMVKDVAEAEARKQTSKRRRRRM